MFSSLPQEICDHAVESARTCLNAFNARWASFQKDNPTTATSVDVQSEAEDFFRAFAELEAGIFMGAVGSGCYESNRKCISYRIVLQRVGDGNDASALTDCGVLPVIQTATQRESNSTELARLKRALGAAETRVHQLLNERQSHRIALDSIIALNRQLEDRLNDGVTVDTRYLADLDFFETQSLSDVSPLHSNNIQIGEGEHSNRSEQAFGGDAQTDSVAAQTVTEPKMISFSSHPGGESVKMRLAARQQVQNESSSCVEACCAFDSQVPFIRVTDVAVYQKLWTMVSASDNHAADADKCVQLFTKSNLSLEVLRDIWELSDSNNTGKLDRAGFFVALKLIALGQQGKKPCLEGLIIDTQAPELSGKSVSFQQSFDASTLLKNSNVEEELVGSAREASPQEIIVENSCVVSASSSDLSTVVTDVRDDSDTTKGETSSLYDLFGKFGTESVPRGLTSISDIFNKTTTELIDAGMCNSDVDRRVNVLGSSRSSLNQCFSKRIASDSVTAAHVTSSNETYENDNVRDASLWVNKNSPAKAASATIAAANVTSSSEDEEDDNELGAYIDVISFEDVKEENNEQHAAEVYNSLVGGIYSGTDSDLTSGGKQLYLQHGQPCEAQMKTVQHTDNIVGDASEEQVVEQEEVPTPPPRLISSDGCFPGTVETSFSELRAPEGDIPDYIAELNDKIWYHGLCDRWTSQMLLLRFGQPGSYLVRKSPNSDQQYVLSIHWNGVVRHMKIDLLPNSCSISGLMFSTVCEMLDYFMHNPFPPTTHVEDRPLCLTRYIDRSFTSRVFGVRDDGGSASRALPPAWHTSEPFLTAQDDEPIFVTVNWTRALGPHHTQPREDEPPSQSLSVQSGANFVGEVLHGKNAVANNYSLT